jgi:hypothetical protein
MNYSLYFMNKKEKISKELKKGKIRASKTAKLNKLQAQKV